MSKKNYIKAAEIVAKSDLNQDERKLLAEAFVSLFRDDNHLFNKDKFIYACHLEVR